VISGSLMTWACYREGSVATWIRRDLEAVLQVRAEPPTEGPSVARIGKTPAKRRQYFCVTPQCRSIPIHQIPRQMATSRYLPLGHDRIDVRTGR
jgi:hypothetical protein